MRQDELRKYLNEVDFFGGLSRDVQDHLTAVFQAISEEKTLPEGLVLFRAGEKGSNRGYVILEGDFSVQKPNTPMVHAESPDLLGEIELFNPSKQRTATVEAMTDLKVLEFQWSDFMAKCKELLKPEQYTTVRDAIESHAWQHFAE